MFSMQRSQESTDLALDTEVLKQICAMYYPESEINFEADEQFDPSTGGLDMKDDKEFLVQTQCLTDPLPEPEKVEEVKEEGDNE